jgi:hypothetical protein
MSAYRKFVDILQSEPRIPTPPKPAKAPKANPSEPVSLPVLGSLGTLYQVSLMKTHTEAVLARSETTKQSKGSQATLDCFARGSQ